MQKKELAKQLTQEDNIMMNFAANAYFYFYFYC